MFRHTYSQEKNLFDIIHFCLVCCVSRVYYFRLANVSIHIYSDDENVVFGNVSDKRRYQVIKGGDVRFIICIGWTVARDDCCAAVAIKCSPLGWIFSRLFRDFKVRGLRSISTPPLVPLTKFLHADANTNFHLLPGL